MEVTKQGRERLNLPNGWYLMVKRSHLAEDWLELYDPNDTPLMEGYMAEPELFAAAMSQPVQAAPQQDAIAAIHAADCVIERLRKLWLDQGPVRDLDEMSEWYRLLKERAVAAAPVKDVPGDQTHTHETSPEQVTQNADSVTCAQPTGSDEECANAVLSLKEVRVEQAGGLLIEVDTSRAAAIITAHRQAALAQQEAYYREHLEADAAVLAERDAEIERLVGALATLVATCKGLGVSKSQGTATLSVTGWDEFKMATDRSAALLDENNGRRSLDTCPCDTFVILGNRVVRSVGELRSNGRFYGEDGKQLFTPSWWKPLEASHKGGRSDG